MLGGDEARRRPEAEVVGVGRIGHDQVARARDLHEIGQVVVVGVGIVEEAAFVDHQLAGVDGGAEAAVPAYRPLAAGALEGLHGEPDMRALLLPREAEHLLPAPAVAAYLVAAGDDGAGDLRVLLEGDGAGVEGGLDPGLLEEPEDAPDAGARAVLEHRFHGEVAVAGRQGVVAELGQPLLVGIAHGLRVFRPFLVIHDHRDGEPCASGPGNRRGARAIAHQIAPAGRCVRHDSSPLAPVARVSRARTRLHRHS